MRALLLGLYLSILISIPAYAVATPSDAIKGGGSNEKQSEIASVKPDNVSEVRSDDDIKLHKDTILEALYDFINRDSSDNADLVEFASSDNRSSEMLMAPLRALNYNPSGFKNVVIFEGTFNNVNCKLIIPYGSYQYINYSDGYIVNVGSSQVVGRILYNDDKLDPETYETYSYIINPVYGSPGNVLIYGSFNYERHYYEGTTGRIAYSDTYGNFYVDDVKVFYSNSERLYYLGLIILLFMGVSALWKRH